MKKSEGKSTSKWNFSKANCDKYTSFCGERFDFDVFKDKEDPIQPFSETLVNICKECIPKSSKCAHKQRLWFNNECKETIKLRNDNLIKSIPLQPKKIYTQPRSCEPKLDEQ